MASRAAARAGLVVVAAVLTSGVVSGCGQSAREKAGATTCDEYVRMTPAERLDVIKTWLPDIPLKAQKSQVRYLDHACTPAHSDPGGHIDQIVG